MKFSIERCLLFCILFFCLLLSRQSFGQIYINSPTVYPSSTTISQNLIVNDTLWVQGDLTLANKVVLTINQGGVVIIQENLITANKITLDIDSYLFILGSLTHTGAEKHAEAVVSDASHVYIFGDVSADFDNTDIACPDVDYEQGTINNCGHGTLDDFLEGESDNPIFEQIVSDKVEPTNNLVSFPEDGQLCPSGNVTLSIQEPEASNIFWYQDGVKVESAGALTKDVYSVGIYHAIYKLGTQWYQTNEISVTNDHTSPSVNCPPPATFDCIENLPQINNIADFESIGGAVSDNCNLTISYEDVTATASGCRVIRTYTIMDESKNMVTCEQEFTIRDDIDPVIACVDLSFSPTNDDCSVTIPVDKPVINADTDNCKFGDIEPVYSFFLFNNPENEITGSGDIPETNFPLGRTTITWTFADECGNSVACTQIIDVTFELSEISYDNGSTSTDVGSGVYPMQTSTHTYAVDSKIPEVGYSYQWKLFERNGENLGDEVDPAYYIINQTEESNGTSVAITFLEDLRVENEYFIAVEKWRDGTLCGKQETLPIRIYPHDFDVELLPAGSDCQAGETGTPSTITWEISFPEIVTEPFLFNYNITLDGTPICTGTVSGISYSNTSLNHDSGCPVGSPAAPPYTLVSKNQNSNTVRLEYVISSVTGSDLQIGLTVKATDAFEVSDSNVSNDSEDVILWGVPNTSDITTD
ncbi:hypothetical protein [uncultured Sunxiuqinia sp.]|uniref:hypothetical protein n=1 Tax=uncultured Sunxiuqinia sp. TaxID=1573825 RepID=UPI00260A927B|nr:hypothetical protein [uncultured Sunxiuqinia sp.]